MEGEMKDHLLALQRFPEGNTSYSEYRIREGSLRIFLCLGDYSFLKDSLEG